MIQGVFSALTRDMMIYFHNAIGYFMFRFVSLHTYGTCKVNKKWSEMTPSLCGSPDCRVVSRISHRLFT